MMPSRSCVSLGRRQTSPWVATCRWIHLPAGHRSLRPDMATMHKCAPRAQEPTLWLSRVPLQTHDCFTIYIGQLILSYDCAATRFLKRRLHATRMLTHASLCKVQAVGWAWKCAGCCCDELVGRSWPLVAHLVEITQLDFASCSKHTMNECV